VWSFGALKAWAGPWRVCFEVYRRMQYTEVILQQTSNQQLVPQVDYAVKSC
jgi:hypothetical protein